VIAGSGQVGKADQGVFAYWLLAHHFRRPLRYIGYGGTGKQVRDLLHVEDLYRLIEMQLAALDHLTGSVFNVGGGAWNLSLCEATTLCRDLTGHAVPIEPVPDNRPGDVPWYVTDNARVTARLGWQPRKSPQQTLADLHAWVVANEGPLKTLF
jgi:CDP-paratose 2-epimerase